MRRFDRNRPRSKSHEDSGLAQAQTDTETRTHGQIARRKDNEEGERHSLRGSGVQHPNSVQRTGK